MWPVSSDSLIEEIIFFFTGFTALSIAMEVSNREKNVKLLASSVLILKMRTRHFKEKKMQK